MIADAIEAILHRAIQAATEKKAHRIVALDLRAISTVVDYYVVCHGNSEPQVQAIVQEIRKAMGEAGVVVRGIEGMQVARWVLIDLGDVVVHVFHKEERDYYNIERVWADAPQVHLP